MNPLWLYLSLLLSKNSVSILYSTKILRLSERKKGKILNPVNSVCRTPVSPKLFSWHQQYIQLQGFTHLQLFLSKKYCLPAQPRLHNKYLVFTGRSNAFSDIVSSKLSSAQQLGNLLFILSVASLAFCALCLLWDQLYIT